MALQIVSYIGCGISSICLFITVVFYTLMGYVVKSCVVIVIDVYTFQNSYRKKLFNAVHYFVHLNLALSLLLGYVVFMIGIELGTSSTVCEIHGVPPLDGTSL